MNSAALPYSISILIAGLIAATLFVLALTRLPARGAKSFAVMMLSIAIWGIGYAFEFASISLESKLFWIRVEYIGIVLLPPAWLVFTMRYSNQERWIAKRGLWSLLIIPLISLGLMWTNGAHQLFYKSTVLHFHGDLVGVHQVYGPGYWLFFSYAQIVMLSGFFVLLRTFRLSPKLYRRQILALLIGALVPLLGKIVYLFVPNSLPNLDVTPMGFMLTGVALYWGLYRGKLLKIAPIARKILLKSMTDGVMVMDRSYQIVYINPAMEKIFRADEAAVIGSKVSELCNKWPKVLDILLDKNIQEGEVIIEIDGDENYYDLRISTVLDEHRIEVDYIAVFRDITQRVLAEKAAKDAEGRYQNLVESSPDAIGVHADGIYIYMNPAGLKLLGTSEESEIVGKPVLDFISDEMREEVGDRLLNIYKNRISMGPFEELMLGIDGKLLEVEVTIEPIIHAGEQAIQVLLRDISQRKREQQNYQQLIETSPDAIGVHAEGKFVYVNSALIKLFGAKRKIEIVGKSINKFLHPDYHQLVSEANKVISSGARWTGSNERIIFRLDGQERYVETYSEQIVFKGVDSVQSVIRDISARKREEDRLERQIEELAVLHSVALAAAEANSEDELIDEITAIVGAALFPNNFGVMLLDEQSSGLVAHKSYRLGTASDKDNVTSIPVIAVGEGITGNVVASGKAIRTGDVTREPKYLNIFSVIKSELCVPIKSGDRVVGVINTERDIQNAFTKADERLLQTIAGQLAAGIDKVRFLEEIQRLAVTDSLTLLNNRRQFFKLAQNEFDRARRFRRPLVAIMFDLDKFKNINEKFGHSGGDQALISVAHVWKEALRDVDVIGRYGGDEFAAILSETKLEEGIKIAERVCHKIQNTKIKLGDGEISLTTSIGVSTITDELQHVDEMIELADKGLFEAKKLGGNTVRVFIDKP